MSVVKCVSCGNEFNICSPANHYKKFHSNLTDIELSKLHYLNNPKMGDFGLEFIDYLFGTDYFCGNSKIETERHRRQTRCVAKCCRIACRV